jgi:hypothetical protein
MATDTLGSETELAVLSETQLAHAKVEFEKKELLTEAVAEAAAEDFAAAIGEDVDEDDDEFRAMTRDVNEDDDEEDYDGEDYDQVDHDFEEEEDDAENTRPYQNKLLTEVIRKKNTSISISQAKLFGIPMDRNGRVSVPNSKAPDTDKQLDKILKRIGKMSDPVQSDLSHIRSEDDIESTFRPQKNPAAVACMKNPKLGYDFIDKVSIFFMRIF